MILDFWATWSFSLGLLSGVVLTLFAVTLLGEWFNNRQKKQENAERAEEVKGKKLYAIVNGLPPLSTTWTPTEAEIVGWPQRRRVAR